MREKIITTWFGWSLQYSMASALYHMWSKVPYSSCLFSCAFNTLQCEQKSCKKLPFFFCFRNSHNYPTKATATIIRRHVDEVSAIKRWVFVAFSRQNKVIAVVFCRTSWLFPMIKLRNAFNEQKIDYQKGVCGLCFFFWIYILMLIPACNLIFIIKLYWPHLVRVIVFNSPNTHQFSVAYTVRSRFILNWWLIISNYSLTMASLLRKKVNDRIGV